MKASHYFLIGASLAVIFSACQQTPQSANQNRSSSNRYGAGTQTIANQTDAMPTPSPSPTPTPQEQTNLPPSNPTPNRPVSGRDLPFGTPVPGQMGFVTSPHDPTAGLVDVRGFAPGQEVRCPYTGKTFLVP